MKFLFFPLLLTANLCSFAQRNSDCPIVDMRTDTVLCNKQPYIVDIVYCSSTGLYQDGIMTDLMGNEEFCFFYKYDSQNNLKRVTFHTFIWNNKGGYTTKDKIGVFKIKNPQNEWKIKNGFTLDEEFVKLVTKI